MTEPRTSPPTARAIALVFRAVVFLVALTTAKAAHFAIMRKSEFLESFPGASESVYVFFLLGSVIGFVSLVGLFYFQRWATWVFGILALFVTIVNVGVSAPLLHTLSGAGLTLVILILGSSAGAIR